MPHKRPPVTVRHRARSPRRSRAFLAAKVGGLHGPEQRSTEVVDLLQIKPTIWIWGRIGVWVDAVLGVLESIGWHHCIFRSAPHQRQLQPFCSFGYFDFCCYWCISYHRGLESRATVTDNDS